MKKLILVFLIAGMAGLHCKTLAPMEERQATITAPTGVSKNTAYRKTLEFMARTLQDSRRAIHYQDPESGVITGRMSLSGCVPWYLVSVVFDFQMADGSARFQYMDIQKFSVDEYGERFQTWGPSDARETAEVVAGCLAPFSSAIVSAISQNPGGDRTRAEKE